MIGRLTFADYNIIIKAIEKQAEDKNKDMHLEAYLTTLAGERDAKGKPRFPTFKHFYHHKSPQQDRFEKLKEHLRNK